MENLVQKFEAFLTYYAEHREELWKPFTSLAIFWNFMVFASTLSSWMSLLKSEFATELPFWFYGTIVIQIAGVLAGLLTRSAIKARKKIAMTSAATLMVALLLSGQWLLFTCGLYVFMNGPFRASIQETAPRWYKSLTQSISESV